jgi:ankyrin repeat protein
MDSRAGKEQAQTLPKKQRQHIEALIDRLADIADSDYGYSPTVNGNSFLPIDAEGHMTSGMLFQRPPVTSNTLRELVNQGAAAVPQLLEHLTDQRRTKILITGSFGFFCVHEDPQPDNGKQEAKKEKRPRREPQHLGHVITVGDLCYVALGQILNRDYSAVTYIPSGIVSVKSPTHAPSIAKELHGEWGSLTPAKHRANLVAELMRPGDEGTVDAAKRLAYYYPDALAEPVLKLFKRPVYDVFIAQEFARKQLYKAKDAKEARARFDAFLKQEGEVYRYALELQLLGDLDFLEAHEQGLLSSPLTLFQDQPRRLLIQLYGKDKSVTSTDKPKRQAIWSDADLVPFLKDGLSYDQTPAVEAAVLDLLRTTKIDCVAATCIEHLIGRGFDDQIEPYLKARGNRKDLKDAAQTFRTKQGWTRLHLAVEKKYLERIRAWIGAQKDLNVSARSGVTPLHLAAAAGSQNIVALLLGAGARVNEKNKAGETPLQLAVKDDHLEVARLLLDKGAEPTDILAAAFAGRADLVGQFVADDKAAVRRTTALEATSMHLAAWEGKVEVVKVLLRSGPVVNGVDGLGMTPLHLAALRGHDQVMRVLLDHKADIKAKTRQAQQPLTLAVMAGQLSTAKIFVERKANPKEKSSEAEYSLLHVAASEGHRDCLAWLLSMGLPINGRDKREHSPLDYAAQFGHASCVEYLLEHKADVGANAEEMPRPLSLAIAGGHLDVVRILIKHGVHLDKKSAWGESPAQLAEAYDQPEMAALLRKSAQEKSPHGP